MKQLVFAIVILIAVSLLAGGCGGTDEQLEIAKKFWNAMEARDIDEAKKYATRETADGITMQNDDDNADIDIAFGEVTNENDKSMVATTITTVNDGVELDIPMNTVLVREEGEWRVDVTETMMSMLGGAMGAMMEGLTETMKDSMEDISKEMAEQMKSSMEGIDN